MQSNYPEDVMNLAEEALDNLLCNCSESCGGPGGVRKASIADIARAIMADRKSRATQPPSAADPSDEFLAQVSAELKRARAKFPGDRIMTIALAEEFGELAKAMLDENGEHVWKEAVQTAVMAARVAIDGDSSVDEWRKTKGLDNHRMAGREALNGRSS